MRTPYRKNYGALPSTGGSFGHRPSTGSTPYARSGTSNYSSRNNSFSRSTSERTPYRKSYGGGQSRFGGGSRGRSHQSRGRGTYIDPAKLVYKATVTEEIEEYQPTHAFTDFLISDSLKKNITTKGYIIPTPIQDKSIPNVLLGKDVVGIANTGTGKTAAFLVPLVDKIIKNPAEKVLIIVPTRELAVQIENELTTFVKGLSLYAVILIGGANIGRQLGGLRRRYNFVIGTPGRIKDMVERRALNLSEFKTLVLDEADRMLDMGFIKDIRSIVSLLPPLRQTLFFSATFSREIEAIIHEFLREPIKISVKVQDTSKNVDQDIIRVARGQNKLDMLHNLLIKPGFGKVLIFGRTKHGVEKLTKDLIARGFRAESIHGNKNQGKRQKALSLFKEHHVQILVATDVAARGLDIADISHVINYDMPATYDDYIHRIGRTGRWGKKGSALTFVE